MVILSHRMVEWCKNTLDFKISGGRQRSKSHVAAQPPENVIRIYNVDIERHYI